MGNCPGGSRGIYNRCPGTARSTTHKISNFARAVRAARANAPNQAPYSVSHSLLSKNYMPELHFLRGCPDCSGSHRHRAKGSTRTTLLWHSVFLPFARAPQRQIACKTRFRPGSPVRFALSPGLPGRAFGQKLVRARALYACLGNALGQLGSHYKVNKMSARVALVLPEMFALVARANILDIRHFQHNRQPLQTVATKNFEMWCI